jgi:hypothetical protein
VRGHRRPATFAGQIIETGTTSYRLAHARKRRSTADQ